MTGWAFHRPRADLYQVLGVGRDATREQIARAYRQQARSAHPDAHPADPQAAARFRALTSAYDVLSDPVRRDDYDRQQAAETPPEPRTAPPAPPVPPYAPPVFLDGPPGFLDEPPVFLDGPPVFLDGPPLSQNEPPLSPYGPPLWAGPVRVQPDDAGVGQGPGQADDLDALAMLARLLGRYQPWGWPW